MSLTLEPGAWSPAAERWLSQALAGATLDALRRQVEAGARLFYVKAGGVEVGAFLLRVDATDDGAEGVIVAGAGQLAGCDLVAACVPAIESLFLGCRRVRFHTALPALARKFARLGYMPREIVCSKELTHA